MTSKTVVIPLDVFHKIAFLNRVLLFFNLGVLVDWRGAEAKSIIVDDVASLELFTVLTDAGQLLANRLLLRSFLW